MKTALKYLFFLCIASLLYIIAVDIYKSKIQKTSNISVTTANTTSIQ